jgi:hypothetical protein
MGFVPDDIDLHVRNGNTLAMYILGQTEDGGQKKVVYLSTGYYFGETTLSPFGTEDGEAWAKVWHDGSWVGFPLAFLESISFHQPGGKRLTLAPINLHRFVRLQPGLLSIDPAGPSTPKGVLKPDWVHETAVDSPRQMEFSLFDE